MPSIFQRVHSNEIISRLDYPPWFLELPREKGEGFPITNGNFVVLTRGKKLLSDKIY